MRRILTLILILTSFLLVSVRVEAATLTCSDNLNGKISISEFFTGDGTTSTQWIELLNTDQDNSINLQGCTIKDGSNTTLKSLTGTLPRGGFLTFTLSTAMSTTGGVLRAVGSDGSTSFNAVYYGTEAGTPHVDAPSSTQSASAPGQGGGDWSVGSTTKGWCNAGFTGCPTISTITSQMSSEGVSTNLGSQTDYSRTTGLYFQKSETNDPNGTPMGKITFLSEINFTDRDALSWMQSLGTSIDMSTKGRIGLNADLIANLISTNAQLTMYGLTYSDPTVDVTDTSGNALDSSIVSGLTYSNGTLTFTAAHFTTFTARERSSGGMAAATVPKCENAIPNKAPDLFRIDSAKNSAKLYFSPVNNAVDHYYIAYGLSEGDERYGVKFDKGYYDGVIDYTVKDLIPNTKYYFKVRAGNGCATGNWSSWLMAKTEGGASNTTVDEAKNDLKEATKISQTEVEEKLDVSPTQKPVEVKIPQKNKQTAKLSWWQKIISSIVSFFRKDLP